MNFAVVRNADTFWGKIVASELACLGRNLILLGDQERVLQSLSAGLIEAYEVRVMMFKVNERNAGEVLRVCASINDHYAVDLLVNLNQSASLDTFADMDIWSVGEASRLGFQAEMEFTHQLLPNLQQYVQATMVNLAVEAAIPASLEGVFQAVRAEFHQLVSRETGVKSNRSELSLPWTADDMTHTMVVHALRNQIRDTLESLLKPRNCLAVSYPML